MDDARDTHDLDGDAGRGHPAAARAVMLAPRCWLIGPPAAGLPEPVYLHVFEDEAETAMDFVADRARALRFASPDDAARFARDHHIAGVEVTSHPVSELVGAAHHVPGRIGAAPLSADGRDAREE